MRKNIAVIGSGIAGLSAAWLLGKSHAVTIIEQDVAAGGHACTVDTGGAGVDMGFIVYNEIAYPNLTALFSYLGVETCPSQMSFSVSLDGGTYEYSGAGIASLFGQPANIFSPAQWALVTDILRFFRTASTRIEACGHHVTLGDFLASENYSRSFIDRHLLPMAAAIWSAGPQEMLGYPARAFIRFFANHGLLKFTNRPAWRTVRDGSRNYVARLLADSPVRLSCGKPAKRITRAADGVSVTTADGETRHFDHVVVACHADQALGLLGDADEQEHRLLSPFRSSENRAILHSDPRLMPKRRRLWSAWNYIGLTRPASAGVSVSYWMNALQPLSSPSDLFVSLNPPVEPRADAVVAEKTFRHPVFSAATLDSQERLWAIQGRRRTWFCGAWFGAGFHEDGLQAGLAVAEQLGGLRRPWRVANESGRIHTGPRPPESHDSFAVAAE